MWLVDGGCDDEVDQKRSVLMLLLLFVVLAVHVVACVCVLVPRRQPETSWRELLIAPTQTFAHHVVTWEGSRIRGSPRNRKMLRRHILAISDNVRHG